ncbi:MAG: hypothetical protein ACYCWE_21020 [Eubacteriales bacterium]
MKTEAEIKDITIAQLKHQLKSMRDKEKVSSQAIKELNCEIARLRETHKTILSLIIYIIKKVMYGMPLIVAADEYDEIYNNETILLFEENSVGDCIVKLPCKKSAGKAS